MDDRTPSDGAPRRPGFQGSSFGDDAFRDDRFDDPSLRSTHAAEPLSDMLAEDDRPLASPWTRLGAQLLDGLLFVVSILPGVVVGGLLGGFDSDDPPLAMIVLLVLTVIAYAGYQLYLLSTEGQTLGKRFLKLRIVDEVDGANPGFVRAVLLRALAPGVIGSVPFLGSFFTLADYLFIFRDDRKCIHDHFAKTVVVTEAEGSYAGRVAY